MKLWLFSATLIASVVSPGAIADAALPAESVLVKWRDLALTRADYEAALRAIPEADRFSFELSMRRVTELLNGMLLSRTLAAEARQLAMDKDPDIQKEIEIATERLLAGRRLEAYVKGIKVPDMAPVAAEQYRLKPQDFAVPEAVRLSHILVDTKTRNAAQARARAEEARARAVKGEDFSALAKEFSDDPSARNNQGKLGVVTRGRMVKPFEEAAFALDKAGAISAVVETQFGFHVILLHERIPARQRDFAEVKDELMARLTKSYIEKERLRYVEAIASDPSIVINTEALDKLKKESPPAPAAK